MSEQPFQCEVPGCTGRCSRIPHVCTKHFIEGWGRLPDMPLPGVLSQPINGSMVFGARVVLDKVKKPKVKKK